MKFSYFPAIYYILLLFIYQSKNENKHDKTRITDVRIALAA